MITHQMQIGYLLARKPEKWLLLAAVIGWVAVLVLWPSLQVGSTVQWRMYFAEYPLLVALITCGPLYLLTRRLANKADRRLHVETIQAWRSAGWRHRTCQYVGLLALALLCTIMGWIVGGFTMYLLRTLAERPGG